MSEGGCGPRLHAQPVADVVEAHGMGQLREDHRAEVVEHAEGAGLGLHARLPGGLRNEDARNELEHLPKNVDVVACWLGGGSAF